MKELIKVVTNKQGQKLVSGRELHEVLEIGTRFNDWIKRMVSYGFIENEDYTLLTQKRVTNNPKNPYTEEIDYILTLEMAKHISMVQRTEIGMKVRNYFLECEKAVIQQKLDSYMIDNPVERAKRWIEEEEQRQALALELKEAQPKVEYYDTVLQPNKLITVTAIAKDLGMSARDLNNVLHRLGVQYKLGNSWHLYSLYQHLVPTHFDYQITAYGQSLRVTEQGRKWIIELLKEYNIIK